MRARLTSTLIAGLVSLGLAEAHATTLEQGKSEGFLRGSNANEKPYAFMDADGNAKGIGPEVATAVWKALGVKDVAWSVTPFGTLIPGLKARRYDFVGAEMNILPDRCKQVAFTDPDALGVAVRIHEGIGLFIGVGAAQEALAFPLLEGGGVGLGETERDEAGDECQCQSRAHGSSSIRFCFKASARQSR